MVDREVAKGISVRSGQARVSVRYLEIEKTASARRSPIAKFDLTKRDVDVFSRWLSRGVLVNLSYQMLPREPIRGSSSPTLRYLGR